MNDEIGAYESLRTRDVRFAYRRAGHGGQPVILMHGWPQTSFAWRRVVPLLKDRYDVIAPDLPGFGYSSKPESGFDKKTVSHRLREFVHALGLSRIALAGHDLGGHVAYAYAAQWPDEVSHLVFIESSLPCFGQEAAMDVAKGGSWHFGFNMAGDISEELVRGREMLFVEHFMRREKVGLYDAEAVSVALRPGAGQAGRLAVVVQLLPHASCRPYRQRRLGPDAASHAGPRGRCGLGIRRRIGRNAAPCGPGR